MIVPPQLMEDATEHKVNDTTLFTCIGYDPRQGMYDKLIDMCKSGKWFVVKRTLPRSGAYDLAR